LKSALARSLVVLFLLLASLGAAGLGSRRATAETSGRNQIQVWTANIRKMNHIGPNVWRKFVDRMSRHDVDPDLIALTEICNQDRGGVPLNDVFEFIVYLEGITGDQFDYMHSGDPGTECEEANSMVVWREARFELANRPHAKRWSSFTDTEKDKNVRCSKSDGNNLAQVAVALRDKRQQKTLIFSSVHVPVSHASVCINENVAFMDHVFEELRSERPLTIVGGDFNQMAQHESDTSGDEQLIGTQLDPSCWYRSLNLLTVDDLSRCVSEPKHVPRRYSANSDYYVDTVHVRHLGLTPGTAHPSICDEWTHNRKFAARGTACTDISGKQDVPDGLSDRGRIDYIFARWEKPNGNALPLDATTAQGLVTDAAADKPPPPRYSDHRAVRALIRWCLPLDPC
jgi:hypothetical protein